MKKKLSSCGIDVIHTPVDHIPADAKLVMTHEGLTERAAKAVPNAVVVPFSTYMGDPAFDKVVDAIKHGTAIGAGQIASPHLTADSEEAELPASSTGWEGTQQAEDANTAPKNKPAPSGPQTFTLNGGVLPRENIRLGLPSVSKEEAIRQAGQVLVSNGAFDPEYIDGMIAR